MFSGSLSQETLDFLDKAQLEMDSIKNNELLSRREKKRKSDSLTAFVHGPQSPLMRNDTIIYSVDSIEKLRIYKNNPSKFITATGMSLMSIFGIAWIWASAKSANDPDNPISKSEERQNRLLVIGSLLGMGTSFTWVYTLRVHHYHLGKWKLKPGAGNI